MNRAVTQVNYDNLTDDIVYDKVYEKFKNIVKGRKQHAGLQSPSVPPSWLDKEACRRGRAFFMENITSIMISSGEALILGLCVPNFYRPLVMSGKSHRKEIAMSRYRETGVYVYSWYLDDCWEEVSMAGKNLKKVNEMHSYVAKKVRPIHGDLPDKVDKHFRESEIHCDLELTHQDRILLDDIADIRESNDIPQEYFDYVNDSVAFSQTDMLLVQGAFVAPLLLFPEHFGNKFASEFEVQDFLTLWRTFGYYLGMDDSYNAVQETLHETKIMGHLIMEKILKPCMLHLSAESIHMAKVALPSRGDFHTMIYSKYELVGYKLPKLWQSFTLAQKGRYYWRQIFIPHILPISFIKKLINKLVIAAFDFILKKHQEKTR